MNRFVSVCFFAMVGITSTLLADTVTLNFQTAYAPPAGNGGGKINITYGGPASYDTPFTGYEWTGFYRFTVVDSSPTLFVAGSSIDLFCFELAQYTDPWFAAGPDVEYTIQDPSVGPVGMGTPMGSNRSNLLKRLYNDHYADLTASSDNKKAFQMAVWEIVHETQDYLTGNDSLGSSFNLEAGNFKVNDNASAVDIATGWLNALTLTGDRAAIKAFTNSNHQDQLYWDGSSKEVPCPGALVNLLGLGLVAGFVARRRRRAK
ncbi:MAG: hypothetical protein ACYC6N_03725 [Pirellulaceae bacterium]